jgi:flagellar motor switch protein FliM
MVQTEHGGTPSELQAKILNGLLSGGRLISGSQPVNNDLPVKELPLAMVDALNLTDLEVMLNVIGQSQVPLVKWWAHNKQNAIAIRFANNENDESPNFIMFPAKLVSNLLAVSLGGSPNATHTDRPPSRVEIKFTALLAAPIANAINFLLRTKTHHYSVVLATAKEAMEIHNEQMVHLVDLKLEWDSQTYPISIALAETKIERRAAKSTKMSEASTGSDVVAAEIGKTAISVDVLFKLADQTIERLQNVKVGDVLPLLPSSINEARMQVRGHDIYTGQIGRSGQRFGFRVSQTAQNRTSGLKHMVKSLTSEGEQL